MNIAVSWVRLGLGLVFRLVILNLQIEYPKKHKAVLGVPVQGTVLIEATINWKILTIKVEL